MSNHSPGVQSSATKSKGGANWASDDEDTDRDEDEDILLEVRDVRGEWARWEELKQKEVKDEVKR